MSEWRMEAASVSATLTKTGTAYEALLGVVTEQTVTDIFDGLTWGGGVTQCVSVAVNEVLAEQQNVNLRNIANHIAAGIAGVGNSARQLQAGNEEMATTFQTEMFTAATSGDFSYFDEHGYRAG
ncbi:DUF6507 family protein [Propionicicella superfundia]|uniref:DUF6507 family protein n=1 Tax=Propionicicella superfundia TaxID=348582 RepID=UPI0003F5ACDF|nr:DUF6507 family protein [Propionicicella superfundia]